MLLGWCSDLDSFTDAYLAYAFFWRGRTTLPQSEWYLDDGTFDRGYGFQIRPVISVDQ